MWGKTYVLTVQAINLKGKLSLLSDPANFTVSGNSTQTSTPAAIAGLSATKASAADSIYLVWPSMPEAVNYKLYWDKGSHDNLNVLTPLASTTSNSFTLTYQNSGKVIGSDYLMANGGTFKFWVSYVTADGKES